MIAIHMERQSAGTERYRDATVAKGGRTLKPEATARGVWRAGEAEERMETSASSDIKSDIRKVWTERRWKLGK